MQMLSLERKERESIRIGHYLVLTVLSVATDSVKLVVENKVQGQSFSNEVELYNKPGEHLKLGKHISVSLIDIRFQSARLGIDAPKNVPVHREEIYLKEFTTAV